MAAVSEKTFIAKPFVKWAGGKRSLLPELLKRIPARFNTYFEPFVGGGALFFALRSMPGFKFEHAHINDLNGPLIETYRAVRDDVDGVIRRLRRMKNEREFFERMRAREPKIGAPHAEVAAWFIYLNRVCFNGLWRVNRSGRFNVPFGDYKNPNICDAENLTMCSYALAGAIVSKESFEKAVVNPRRGDVVYFDPPYYPTSPTSNFTAYTSEGFGDVEHVRLRDLALQLKERGVHVLISNSGVPRVRELYAKGFVIEEVAGRRSIHADASKRGMVGDVLIR